MASGDPSGSKKEDQCVCKLMRKITLLLTWFITSLNSCVMHLCSPSHSVHFGNYGPIRSQIDNKAGHLFRGWRPCDGQAATTACPLVFCPIQSPSAPLALQNMVATSMMGNWKAGLVPISKPQQRTHCFFLTWANPSFKEETVMSVTRCKWMTSLTPYRQ